MKNLVLSLNGTNKYGNKRIADMIITRDASNVYGPVERKLDRKIEKKLNKLFVKLLDDASRRKLQYIDNTFNEIVEQISKESGWTLYYDYRWEKMDNFQNKHDPEFRSWDTYTVRYDENSGYGESEEKPFNGYFAHLQCEENSFVSKYREELALLHAAIKAKKGFMAGSYTLKDESNRELAEEICSYMGYCGESESIKVI